MTFSNALKHGTVLLGFAAVAMTPSAALASPGSGITPTNFVVAPFNDDALVNHDRIKFQTKDTTDVRMQKLTFAAGSFSGWHHHPGLLIVAVQSGLVTLTDRNCGVKSYGPTSPNGAVFIEGDDDTVEARSALGAVAYITIVVPRGANPRIDDNAPLCATSMPASRRR